MALKKYNRAHEPLSKKSWNRPSHLGNTKRDEFFRLYFDFLKSLLGLVFISCRVRTADSTGLSRSHWMADRLSCYSLRISPSLANSLVGFRVWLDAILSRAHENKVIDTQTHFFFSYCGRWKSPDPVDECRADTSRETTTWKPTVVLMTRSKRVEKYRRL